GIHLDGVGLFVGQLAGVKIIPGDVGAHVPTYGFHRFEQFGIKHSVSLSRLVASMARLPLCCCIAVKTMADYTTAYRFVGRCMPTWAHVGMVVCRHGYMPLMAHTATPTPMASTAAITISRRLVWVCA